MSYQKAKQYTAVFNQIPIQTPDPKVPDDPLCGNEDIGVAVAASLEKGCVDFYLGKNDLWNALSIWETPGMRSYGFLRFTAQGDFDRYRAQQRLDTAGKSMTQKGVTGPAGQPVLPVFWMVKDCA